MIQIKVDKESEIQWITNVIDSGVMNVSNPYTMKFLGIPMKQTINYQKSDDYVDDLKEKRDEFNKRFSGIRGMNIERLLKDELLNKEKENKK